MTSTHATTTIDHWIGGAAAERVAERFGDVFDPATGTVTKRGALASAADLDAAGAARPGAGAAGGPTPPRRRRRGAARPWRGARPSSSRPASSFTRARTTSRP